MAVIGSSQVSHRGRSTGPASRHASSHRTGSGGVLKAADLLTELLGGLVDLRVTRSVWQVTGGDEAAVREVVLDAKETGCLVQTGDAWSLIAPLPLRRLSALSSLRLGRLSAEAWECAQLLALGSPLPIAVAVKLLEPTMVRELEGVGVARFRRDSDGARLEFRDQVHRHAVLGSLSAADRVRLLDRLDGAFDRSGGCGSNPGPTGLPSTPPALIEAFDADPCLRGGGGDRDRDRDGDDGSVGDTTVETGMVQQVAAAFAGAQRLDRAGVKHAAAAVAELGAKAGVPALASDMAHGVELLMADGRSPQERLVDVRRALSRALPGSDAQIGWWSAVAGRLQFAAGDLEAARDHLIQAGLVVESNDALRLQPRVLVDRALVAACSGVSAEAQRLLGHVASDRDRSVSIAARAELVEAVVAAQYEGAQTACQLALDSGDRSVAAGRLKEGLEAWHLVVRFGQAGEVAARLGSLQEPRAWADHPEATLFQRHTLALAAGHGPALAAAAKGYAAAGRYLVAAEAAAQAAAVTDDAQTLALAAGLAGRVPAARTPALDGAIRTTLTPRRGQVAALAVSGLDGRQIADRLGLSSRTADNHLAHVYGQLGVSGRKELERLYGPALLTAQVEPVTA